MYRIEKIFILLLCVVLWAGCRDQTPVDPPSAGFVRLLPLNSDMQLTPDSVKKRRAFLNNQMSAGEPSFIRITNGGVTLTSVLLTEETCYSTQCRIIPESSLRCSVFASKEFSPDHSGDVFLEISVMKKGRPEPVLTQTEKIPVFSDFEKPWLDCCFPFDLPDDAYSIQFKVRVKSVDREVGASSIAVYVGNPVIHYPNEKNEKPDVWFIVFDTLRADRLGCYGYPEPVSPSIDRFSQHTVQFSSVIAPSSWTCPSVNSILTGMYPHRSKRLGLRLSRSDSEFESLPERFAQNGYYTVGVSSNILITPDRDYDRGFDLFDTMPCAVWHSGAPQMMLDRTVKHIKSHPDTPQCLYFHSIDPHDRYQPPHPYDKLYPILKGDMREWFREGLTGPSGKGFSRDIEPPNDVELQFLHSNYLGEIRCMDGILEKLVIAHKKIRPDRELVIVFTSDHGEGFMEHGNLSHSRDLWEESVRVPLMFTGNINDNHPCVKAANVSLVDIFPSIMKRMGMDTASDIDGRDILDSQYADQADTRMIFSLLRNHSDLRPYWRTVYRGHNKVIFREDQDPAYFNLDIDPEETGRNPVPAHQAALLSELEDLIAGEQKNQDKKVSIDKKLKQQLKQLGYIE